MRQVGGSLGIALMGAIVASSVSVLPTNPAYADQFVEGYHNALHVAAAIAIVGAIVAVATVRKVRHPRARSAARVRRRIAWRHASPAEQRKAAVLDSACGIFSSGSYRGTTTAQIARKAGVTEPVLYRHFASKRDLYLAVLEESWRTPAAALGRRRRGRAGPAALGRRHGAGVLRGERPKVRCADLWVQALTEASDDPVIRKFLRKQMREVHDYVTDVIRRSQEAGGIYPDREASPEAWIFLAIGLLGTVGRRVGGLIHDEFPAIVTSRRRWMTGIEDTPDISSTLDI